MSVFMKKTTHSIIKTYSNVLIYEKKLSLIFLYASTIKFASSTATIDNALFQTIRFSSNFVKLSFF